MYRKPQILFCFFLLFIVKLNSQTVTCNNGNYKISPTPTVQDANNPKAKYGLYFWEFGDGHYKITEEPKVVYKGATKGTKPGKVHLIPFYTAVAKPIVLDLPVSMTSGAKKASYEMNNSLIHIESSANGEVVPGHGNRVAVHYKAGQATSKGYLAFFYNNEEEIEDELDVSFNPFNVSAYGTYYNEKVVTTIPALSSGAQSAFNSLRGDHKSCVIFETGSMKTGEERRVFLTALGVDELKKNTGKKNTELTFTALWLPATGGYKAATQKMEYSMKLLQVHDPNRLFVNPRRFYYKKGKQKIFEYELSFQNEAKGIVRDAKVAMYLGKGVDRSTLKVLSVNAVNKKQEWKKDCSATERDSSLRCFEIDNTGHPDSLYFIFHNIDLPGKKVFNPKRSKGYVKFTVESNGKAGRTNSRAGIIFDGEKPEMTNTATTKWRQRGFFLKAGLNLAADGLDYLETEASYPDKLAIGLSYKDAPIGRGIAWGFALDYSGFRMEKISEEAITSALVPNGGFLSQVENLKMNFGEAKIHLGYQFGRIFRVYGTSGISMPISSKFELAANVKQDIDASPLIEDFVEGEFGFLSKNLEPTIFNKTIDTNSFIGYVGGLGIELGAINSIVVGLKGEYRYYNSFYYSNHDCFSLNSFEGYVRFRLFSL